jgi:CRP/FNR family cyclic AMP-dependent transcriptional regulator
MSIAEQLQESGLFRGVKLEDREALIERMQRQSYPEGAVLFEKGDAGNAMYLIVSGSIRIYTTDASGNELTIRHYGQNEIFGEFSPLDGRPRSASAAASAPLDVLVLDRTTFIDFIKERPLVGLTMMRTLVDRVRYTTAYLQKIVDATQRLAQGDYDQAVQEVSESEADAAIKPLVDSFIQMIHQVRAREQSLQDDTNT